MNRGPTLAPTNMRAHMTRGDLYHQANKPHLAIIDFKKVTLALPRRPYAYIEPGSAARLQGDRSKTRHYYLAALIKKTGL